MNLYRIADTESTYGLYKGDSPKDALKVMLEETGVEDEPIVEAWTITLLDPKKLYCPGCGYGGEIKVDVLEVEGRTLYLDEFGDVQESRPSHYSIHRRSIAPRVGTSTYLCTPCGHTWTQDETQVVVDRNILDLEPPELVTPIVHLNGTSKGELVRLRRDVYQALREAVNALSQMSPNGRDYYPEPGRLSAAMSQHVRRAGILSGLMDEIASEAETLQDS